jgi:hypothetical protein
MHDFSNRRSAHHRIQIGNVLYLGRCASDLLLEGIAEIVGRVCRDDQHTLAVLGQLQGNATRRGGLPNASFASHEYPSQAFRGYDVLQRWSVLRLHASGQIDPAAFGQTRS